MDCRVWGVGVGCAPSPPLPQQRFVLGRCTSPPTSTPSSPLLPRSSFSLTVDACGGRGLAFKARRFFVSLASRPRVIKKKKKKWGQIIGQMRFAFRVGVDHSLFLPITCPPSPPINTNLRRAVVRGVPRLLRRLIAGPPAGLGWFRRLGVVQEAWGGSGCRVGVDHNLTCSPSTTCSHHKHQLLECGSSRCTWRPTSTPSPPLPPRLPLGTHTKCVGWSVWAVGCRVWVWAVGCGVCKV